MGTGFFANKKQHGSFGKIYLQSEQIFWHSSAKGQSVYWPNDFSHLSFFAQTFLPDRRELGLDTSFASPLSKLENIRRSDPIPLCYIFGLKPKESGFYAIAFEPNHPLRNRRFIDANRSGRTTGKAISDFTGI